MLMNNSLISICIHTTSRSPLWQGLNFGADGSDSCTTVEVLAQELSQSTEVAACMIYIRIDVASFASRIISCWSQCHITCAHCILSDLLDATGYNVSCTILYISQVDTYIDEFYGLDADSPDSTLDIDILSDDSVSVGQYI